MSEIHLLGIASPGLDEEKKRLLRSCSLVVGADRHLTPLEDEKLQLYPISPLSEAFTKIEEKLNHGDVAVLASGDPLFYGIGKSLMRRFPDRQVSIIPALSSMQEAFARFRIPWDDVHILSLHGRSKLHTAGQLLNNRKTFLFTDKLFTPDRIASELIEYLENIDHTTLLEQCTFHIAENLGSGSERILCAPPHQVAGMRFSDLNVLYVDIAGVGVKRSFGLRENDISHSRGLITKDEVRAATLHRLQLPGTGVFWDIGGGSGSISIEAALLHPQLTIYTIERKDEELSNIKENIRRFGCFNIIPLSGMALDVLAALPSPDAVFVGGSGGQLAGIVTESVRRLKDGGKLVVNGVIEKTITEAPIFMQQHGLAVETSRITVSRSTPDGEISFNPITIMVGQK